MIGVPIVEFLLQYGSLSFSLSLSIYEFLNLVTVIQAKAHVEWRYSCRDASLVATVAGHGLYDDSSLALTGIPL